MAPNNRNPYNPENSLFKRLTRLFSGPIVNQRRQSPVQNKRGNLNKFKFKSASGQQFKKSGYNPFDYIQTQAMVNANRADRYIDFQQMEYYPELNAALDVFADEMTTHTGLEELLKIDCPNQEIKEILHGLYYDVMNVEFNLFGWCRSLCKFGDLFVYLDIHDTKGIQNTIALPAQEVERLEGEDDKNPNYVQFQWNSGGMTFENWQLAHFRILGNDKFAPYGSSVLDGCRRIWRQLVLLEDAMMAYRVTRSAERRVFYIDVGNIAPQDVEQYMQKAMTALKRNQVVDDTTGRVDLRYNPTSVEEDYFLPTRGGVSSKIESLPGGQFTGDIDDVKYLRDKLFSALKIPMSYLSRGEGGEEDKTTLAQKDIRFARTIQRLQRAVISELEKIGMIHLYILGFRGEDLVKFKLSLNNPSKIAELQELEAWRTKFDVASGASEGFFSKRWIAKNIFNMTDEDFLRNQREMFFDAKLQAMLDRELATGGENPVADSAFGSVDLTQPSPDEEPMPTLNDLGVEDNELDLSSDEGPDTEKGSKSDSMLLASPAAKRDDRLTTTVRSKGKMYLPAQYRGGDKRNMGARLKNYQSKFSKELSSGSRRNVMGSGFQDMMGVANGVYESWENNYKKETLKEEIKEPIISESKILDNNVELKRIIENLEKHSARKKNKEE